METSVGFGVGLHACTRGVNLSCFQQVVINILAKIVVVDEVLARVVRRIDVDELDLAQVGFLQQLEGFQVVAFDEQVPGGVEVDAFFPAGAQCPGDGGIGGQQRLALAGPVELVALLRAFDDAGRQFLTKQVEVHCQFQVALFVAGFGHAVGEQLSDAVDVGVHAVGRVHFQFVHGNGGVSCVGGGWQGAQRCSSVSTVFSVWIWRLISTLRLNCFSLASRFSSCFSSRSRALS